MTRTAAGERVRVRQLRVEEWAVGAAEALIRECIADLPAEVL